jgi:hypothetical protein
VSDGPTKIIHAHVDKIEGLLNEHAPKWAMISLNWAVLGDRLYGTALMVDKRELAGAVRGPIVAAPNGRPFGS